MNESDVQLPLLAEAAPLVVAAEPFVVFELKGPPMGKGVPRTRIIPGKNIATIYTDADTQEYMNALRYQAKAAMKGRQPTDKPVALILHAFMSIPTSWNQRDYSAALLGNIRPSTKPDWDNIAKMVDALSRKKIGNLPDGTVVYDHVVWIDDAQVVDGRVIKRYSNRPALRVEVREMLPPIAA